MGNRRIMHDGCTFEYDEVRKDRVGTPVLSNVTLNVLGANGQQTWLQHQEISLPFLLRVADEIRRAGQESTGGAPALSPLLGTTTGATSVTWPHDTSVTWPHDTEAAEQRREHERREAVLADVGHTWMDRALVVGARLAELGVKWICDTSATRPQARLVFDEVAAEVLDFGAVAFWRVRMGVLHVELGSRTHDENIWDGGSEASFDLAIIAAGEVVIEELERRAAAAAGQLET